MPHPFRTTFNDYLILLLVVSTTLGLISSTILSSQNQYLLVQAANISTKAQSICTDLGFAAIQIQITNDFNRNQDKNTLDITITDRQTNTSTRIDSLKPRQTATALITTNRHRLDDDDIVYLIRRADGHGSTDHETDDYHSIRCQPVTPTPQPTLMPPPTQIPTPVPTPSPQPTPTNTPTPTPTPTPAAADSDPPTIAATVTTSTKTSPDAQSSGFGQLISQIFNPQPLPSPSSNPDPANSTPSALSIPTSTPPSIAITEPPQKLLNFTLIIGVFAVALTLIYYAYRIKTHLKTTSSSRQVVLSNENHVV